MPDAVIIGSGLGGLLCGAILSRHGYRVTVLEKGLQTGGCLQSFVRGGLRFDTGFHSVAGLAPGDPLYRIFKPMGLMDLPWEKVSSPDEVVVDGASHFLPRPSDIPALAALRPIAMNMGPDFPPEASYSAISWLKEAGLDPRVMMGASIRLQSPLSWITLHEYAHIAYHFMNGSWRLKGGGPVLAQALEKTILEHGGAVLTRKEAVGIHPEEGLSCTVTCADGSSYTGLTVSDIHPLSTARMVSPALRHSYIRRLKTLVNGEGIFTTYIKLKEKTIRYQDHSISINGMLVHFGNPDSDGYARSVDLLSHLSSPVGDRKALALSYIQLASSRIKGLEEAVDEFWTSTPATWEHYTGTPGGSAYGIMKVNQVLSICIVSPKTPVPGLFLTGQNLGLHGVLGVSSTALRTCALILGQETIDKMFSL